MSYYYRGYPARIKRAQDRVIRFLLFCAKNKPILLFILSKILLAPIGKFVYNFNNMTISDYKILILVPAYNAGKYLRELIERIKKSAPSSDTLIINDGSTDDTGMILNELNINHLTNFPNRGKGYSLKRGFDYAIQNGYDYVVTIDADLQHLPEEIPRFTNRAGEAEIYVGTRNLRSKDMPPHRKLSNWLTSLIISVFSGKRIRDSQTGYRMISTGLLKSLNVTSVKYDFESEQLFQAGRLSVKFAEIPISTVYEGSHSYINPLKDTTRFIRLILRRIML